jgi:hypothetical protein
LLDIYIVIGLDNPAAAERLYTAVETKTETNPDPSSSPRAAPP